jgi:3D (Asp-Asp-Asp) domain-containing protein
VGAPGTALRAGLAAVCVVVLAALQLPAAIGADSPARLREQARGLRAQNDALGSKAEAAWLSSVSLGTRIEHTRAALVGLRARTRSISLRRAEAERNLRSTRHTLAVSERNLADRLRVLYEQGDTDPMAVLVGASSIDEAINGLENLHRIAGQDRTVIDRAKAARARLIDATRRLAAQEAQARLAEEATAASVAALEAARRERAAMLASFRATRSSNSAAIATLESRARALFAAQIRLPSAQQGAPAAGERTITVTATGYSLRGRTATGVAVAYGIVAVDPYVIPFGSRMTVPGYGEGVAADRGGAVLGARIDLWFPTRAEALAWGTRTVTITLH